MWWRYWIRVEISCYGQMVDRFAESMYRGIVGIGAVIPRTEFEKSVCRDLLDPKLIERTRSQNYLKDPSPFRLPDHSSS